MENTEKLELEALELLKKELDFIELEDRLEMVQLAALESDDKRCNGRCEETLQPKDGDNSSTDTK